MWQSAGGIVGRKTLFFYSSLSSYCQWEGAVAGDESVALSFLTQGNQQRGGEGSNGLSPESLCSHEISGGLYLMNTWPCETTAMFIFTFHHHNSPIRAGSLLSSLSIWAN